MATNLKILVPNNSFSVALATSWSQFQTLYDQIFFAANLLFMPFTD